MKIINILTLFIILLIPTHNQTSCNTFTEKYVNELNSKSYFSDGRYNSVTLRSGDDFTLYKPFFRNRNYLIIIACANELPGIKVRITDMQKNIIYDSKKFSKRFDIEINSQKSQNLIIHVEVAKSKEIKQGCVSTVIGYKR